MTEHEGKEEFHYFNYDYRWGNNESRLETKGLSKWKSERNYGYSHMAETAISTIKRILGEHASATRFENMTKEIMIKVSVYYLLERCKVIRIEEIEG